MQLRKKEVNIRLRRYTLLLSHTYKHSIDPSILTPEKELKSRVPFYIVIPFAEILPPPAHCLLFLFQCAVISGFVRKVRSTRSPPSLRPLRLYGSRAYLMDFRDLAFNMMMMKETPEIKHAETWQDLNKKE